MVTGKDRKLWYLALPGNVGYAVAAGVTVDRVAIIAVLADIYDTITAALVRFAVRRATVAVDVVTVVTSLAGIDLAVAASGLAGRRNRADRIAAVGQAVAILVARGGAILGTLVVAWCRAAMPRARGQCSDDTEGDDLRKRAHI